MKLVYLLLMILFLTGCKKFVDVPGSPVQIESPNVFSDDQSATSAMTGLYSQMMVGNMLFCNGGLSLYPALSADELYITGTNANAEQFYLNQLLSSNSIVNNSFWSAGYRFIYHCNAVLEGLEHSTGLTSSVKTRLTGEAKFVRALHYFYLVNLFGDVPMVTTTDYRVNMQMPKTTSAAVYDQIVADLIDAREKLPIPYASSGKVRPNKYAACALLSRIYLYTGKWREAEIVANEIIYSGVYPLLTDLNNVFAANNNESIWQLVKDNNNTSEGAAFIPSSSTAKPMYAFTDTLINRFETGDKRKANWMRSNLIAGKNYYYPYKYKQRTSSPLSEQVVVLRSAEQYLIRAEARLRLNQLDSCVADVNRIRSRAGLPIINTVDPFAIEQAIMKERQTELFAENGHRWLDLKRTNRATVLLTLLKPNFQPYSLLYPVPLTELQRNPFLIQNSGY